MGRAHWIIVGAGFVAFVALACNTSGLSNAPRATFSQLGCLDRNGDGRLSGEDAADASQLPDFNADRKRDDKDAAFLYGVDIPLDRAKIEASCSEDAKDEPEYLVAHGYFDGSDVSCEGEKKAVLLLGVGGGIVNVKDKGSAAGVRSVIDDLQKKYDSRDVQTIALIAGPAIGGAVQVYLGMEQWLSHALRVYFQRFPCLRAVIVGHSFGAMTAEAVASSLEGEFADRIIGVGIIDRVDELYTGSLNAQPKQVPVFNAYETRDGRWHGEAFDSPNYENWDATNEQAPRDGDKGGPLQPVDHTTIDNSDAVQRRMVDEMLERS